MSQLVKFLKISDVLPFVEKIFGKKGPIFLDTDIIKHGQKYDCFDDNNYSDLDIIKIGEKNKQITMDEIKRAFEIIENYYYYNESFRNSNKKYKFQEIDGYGDKYKIYWDDD